MKHLQFIALNDAYRRTITFDDIEIVELGRAYENLLAPIQHGQTAIVKRGTGYSATGVISGKRALIAIYDENVRIAVIGICLHSRTAPSLWRDIYNAEILPDQNPPEAPWVGVRYDVSMSAIPPWLDSLAWHAGWYLCCP